MKRKLLRDAACIDLSCFDFSSIGKSQRSTIQFAEASTSPASPAYSSAYSSVGPSINGGHRSTAQASLRRLLSALAILALALLIWPSTRLEAQLPIGPDSPGQLVVFGAALEELKDPWITEKLRNKQGITSWGFFHSTALANGDFYLGAINFSPLAAPPSIGLPPTLPASMSSDRVRFVYHHTNRDVLPNPITDVIYDSYPQSSLSQRPMPLLLTSPVQLELLIQFCNWQIDGQTPVQMLAFKSWLDQADTVVTTIKARNSGPRSYLGISGIEVLPNGTEIRRSWSISAIPIPGGGFTNLEVTP